MRASRIIKVGLGVVVLAIAGVLVLLALPAIAPTFVARRLLAWATDARCGTFALGGADYGGLAPLDLALGKPVRLGLASVRIQSPSGLPLLDVARIEAEVVLHRSPWRVEIRRALVADGSWRLGSAEGTSQFALAIRPVPPGGRGMCLAPPASAGGGRAPRAGGVTARGVLLRDLAVTLDFPVWGLELGHAQGDGSLVAEAGSPLRFEVHAISAASAGLRIGEPGGTFTTTIPFAEVRIASVGIPEASPTDLLLDVDQARTGRATLSGHARFANLFGTEAPALEMQARWTSLGDALGAIQAKWLAGGTWAKALDGDLDLELDGPFSSLAGRLRFSAPGALISADMARGRSAIALHRLDVSTDWIPDKALRTYLAGRLTGDLHAAVQLGPSLADLSGEIDEALLRLDRHPAQSGPRRIELRVGTPPQARPAAETFAAVIRRARVHASPDEVRATLLPPSRLTAFGQELSAADEVVLDWTRKAGLALRAIAIERRGGGQLTVSGRVAPHGEVTASVSMRDAPVAALPEAAPLVRAVGPLFVSGTAKMRYRQRGTLAAEGRFELRGAIRGGIDGSLAVVGLGRKARATGDVVLTRNLELALPGWPWPVTVLAGGKLTVDEERVETTGLSVRAPGVQAEVSGRATWEESPPPRLALRVTGDLDAGRLPFRLPAGVRAQGRISVDTSLDASPGSTPPELRLDGRASTKDLALSAPALPPARVHGALDLRGRTVVAEQLEVDLAGVGTVRVGRANDPARAELVSLSPLRLGHVDVPLDASHLVLGDHASPVQVRDLTATLRLSGDARSQLRLAGDVAIGSASLAAGRDKSRPRQGAPWFRDLPPGFTLDLQLRGTNALHVSVPVLPDVSFDFQCRLVATDRGAVWSGRVHGSSVYAGAALRIYDGLTGHDLRRCQIEP